MFRVQSIASIDHPLLAPYRTMREQRDHHRQRLFVAEGEKIVRRLLESPLAVRSALMPEALVPAFAPLLEARPEFIEVFVAPKPELERLTGFSMYQGVLAVGTIPPPASLEPTLTQSPRPWFLVAVDALSNSENLGVLVRNCGAFGAHALIVGERCSSPYLRRAVRTSMGVVFKLPLIDTANLARSLAALRARGIRCVAAHPHTERRTVAQAPLAGDCCVVFGSEGYGLSSDVLAACDDAVAIPMSPGIDSLNVASASAVFFYEVARQRGRM